MNLVVLWNMRNPKTRLARWTPPTTSETVWRVKEKWSQKIDKWLENWASNWNIRRKDVFWIAIEVFELGAHLSEFKIGVREFLLLRHKVRRVEALLELVEVDRRIQLGIYFWARPHQYQTKKNWQ